MSNIIHAIFREGNTSANASGLWQWDYGQVLRIEGLKLPKAVELHFTQSGAESKTRIGTTTDYVTDVVIPDSMVERRDHIMVYIYLHTGEDDGETEYSINIPIKERPEPEAYEEHEEYGALVQAIKLLQDDIAYVDQVAAEVDADAEAAAQSESNAAESETNAATSAENAAQSETNAAASATSAAESASAAAEYEADAQNSAQIAASEASAAAQSETNALSYAERAEIAVSKITYTDPNNDGNIIIGMED